MNGSDCLILQTRLSWMKMHIFNNWTKPKSKALEIKQVIILASKDLISMQDKNFYKTEELINQKIEIWQEHVLFSGLWWFGVALSTIPWIIWFLIRKKQSTDRILYVGFYIMAISTLLDILGDQAGLWHYRYHVIPTLPTYFPWDVTLMPVTVMILLQLFPKINPWLKAIFFGLLTSYIAEPFIHSLGIYELNTWRYSYSFPIQILIFMSAHWLSQRSRFAPLHEDA